MNSTTASADQVITEWGKSAVKSKQAASKLAIKLAGREPGTLVESKEKIAVELGVHQSTAQRARLLLQGAGVVYKSGRHLYVSDKAGEPKSLQPRAPSKRSTMRCSTALPMMPHNPGKACAQDTPGRAHHP